MSLKENGWYGFAGTQNINLLLASCRRVKNVADNGLYDCPARTVWISPQNRRQYFLQKKGVGKSNGISIISQIISNGWAGLPTLFDGAYNCTAQVSLF